jgi:hypothetical protein
MYAVVLYQRKRKMNVLILTLLLPMTPTARCVGDTGELPLLIAVGFDRNNRARTRYMRYPAGYRKKCERDAFRLRKNMDVRACACRKKDKAARLYCVESRKGKLYSRRVMTYHDEDAMQRCMNTSKRLEKQN